MCTVCMLLIKLLWCGQNLFFSERIWAKLVSGFVQIRDMHNQCMSTFVNTNFERITNSHDSNICDISSKITQISFSKRADMSCFDIQIIQKTTAKALQPQTSSQISVRTCIPSASISCSTINAKTRSPSLRKAFNFSSSLIEGSSTLLSVTNKRSAVCQIDSYPSRH